jgi:hypothetical protein
MANTHYNGVISILAVAALVLPSLPAAASALTDLQGVRASAAENTIQSRGYHAHHSAPVAGGRYTYWWNNGTKSCVRTLTSDGVISATKTVSGADCGYYGGASSSSGSSKDATAAAAVAAAAIIGVAALSHKSHHRDDKDYQQPEDYAEFERGHRDGLYNHSYSNDRRSDAYNDGYQSGVNERSEQSSYRPEYQNSSRGGQQYAQQNSRYGGGSSDTVGFSDLVGARAAGVETDLQSRGFRNVASEPSDNSKITIWWNSRARQCLQVITANGRADSITDIQTHPRCR